MSVTIWDKYSVDFLTVDSDERNFVSVIVKKCLDMDFFILLRYILIHSPQNAFVKVKNDHKLLNFLILLWVK